ncbi:hypothetical protein jhhlp_000679 [Lomentospora prolificans]|uniref:Nitrate reductase [NADPH] n=1 Tax=Lomentospora prolificans TaxID=41688 RepID=A0A2N3NJ69_9PEZI|nr:hypothetical protein jhhlp_000679 [Lomentospora prolificans]
MSRKPWVIRAKEHPGATFEEIQNEPAWESGHQHRIGFRNADNRLPGFTHGLQPLSAEEEEAIVREARKKFKSIQDKEDKGELVNWRDIVGGLHDFHLVHPEQRPHGWRYVLEAQEDWVKFGQPWPANIKRREKAEKDAKEKEKTKDKDDKASDSGYDDRESTGDEAASPKPSPTSEAFWRETEYISNLGVDGGLHESPQAEANKDSDIAINNDDQMGPDNWIPRHPKLIRLTGKHPLNAQPPPELLYGAGLITPNDIHYVRNHGAVPRLLWEFHQLDIHVENGKMALSMDDLVSQFRTINIPVLLACDGNRRGELNRIRKSKGFTWGAAGVSCAYWRGALLRDVLIAAGQADPYGPDADPNSEKRLWVNFSGADELSDGTYETCIPLDYAMDPTNDVILAFEMNNEALPADHGYPVRLVIPGWVGGRCVKWLQKIWISDKENDSYYHIYDNRVLPSSITDNDSDEAKAMYNNPDTACNEQVLNSVIVKPAHGERMPLKDLHKGDTYRVEGFAFSGGGHPVQRVELSHDGGDTWHYCQRKFPDRPIRHGRKFWGWVFWHVDLPVSELVGAKSLAVRAWNALKCTQPEKPIWNIMGMMNNCWYQVKPEITSSDDAEEPYVLFRHPVELESREPGWMQSSMENKMAAAKIAPANDKKRITRQEFEKHDKDNDCWIVIEGNVYDVTSALSWHPGGKAPLMAHAGKVHQETTDEFNSIHDDFARKKMQECLVGRLTDKAINYIEQNAREKAKPAAKLEGDVGIQKDMWRPAKLLSKEDVSEDTRTYTFKLPEGKMKLGMNTCQHIEVGFHFLDKMLTRSYTPTRPFLPAPEGTGSQGHNLSKDYDGTGTFELTVKTYFPNDDQPGGAMSNILDMIPIGEEIEIRGPIGEIEYHGNGNFIVEGEKRHFKRVCLVVGGSGLTPAYSLISRVCATKDDKTEIRMVDANNSEIDILMRDELEHFQDQSNGQFKLAYVLSKPGKDWKGYRGFVNEEILKENLFPPDDDTIALVCGPPTMISKAVLPVLIKWGYIEDKNLYGF